jgi:hypothetical protein
MNHAESGIRRKTLTHSKDNTRHSSLRRLSPSFLAKRIDGRNSGEVFTEHPMKLGINEYCEIYHERRYKYP